jgi:nicotinamidase/pyrazinamidase
MERSELGATGNDEGQSMEEAIGVQATDALFVVDVQKDFCHGGALAVEDGGAVVPVLNRLIPKFGCVVFTRDWHPASHCSFEDPPRFEDKSWPAHCVADTPGADFHDGLKLPSHAFVINKATAPDQEAYSGFQGTDLAQLLNERSITRVFVGGLATDYCVKNTVLDAIKLGFEAVLVLDACRGIDIPPGTVDEALADMLHEGAVFVHAEDVS